MKNKLIEIGMLFTLFVFLPGAGLYALYSSYEHLVSDKVIQSCTEGSSRYSSGRPVPCKPMSRTKRLAQGWLFLITGVAVLMIPLYPIIDHYKSKKKKARQTDN